MRQQRHRDYIWNRFETKTFSPFLSNHLTISSYSTASRFNFCLGRFTCRLHFTFFKYFFRFNCQHGLHKGKFCTSKICQKLKKATRAFKNTFMRVTESGVSDPCRCIFYLSSTPVVNQPLISPKLIISENVALIPLHGQKCKAKAIVSKTMLQNCLLARFKWAVLVVSR